MKFWKYGRVALALTGSIILGLSITCCGVYTSGYMYVTGTQFNQIGAFKIDHDFGYLTAVTGSPFASGGGDPVQEVVLPGGRFLAVVNKGSNNVSMFTIGGAGTLYFQQSYATSGSNPVSLVLSASGTYMYVLDSVAPDGTGRGDLTAFSIDSNTGKLTLITNQNTFNTSGTQLPYFEVNYKPVQLITAGGYIYVLDTAYNVAGGRAANPATPAACFTSPTTEAACSTPDVFLYAVNATNGQLTLTQNQPLSVAANPGYLTTIATASAGKYVYIANTEGGSSSNIGEPGYILPYTIGASGVLQTLVGGPVKNYTSTVYPDAILANSNANFLYVANFGTGSVQQANSNISAYTIATNGQLQPVPTAQNPYTSGSGPIWLVEDPTNQYLYSVNYNDNTITGAVIDATHGQLSNLLKGTTFATVGQPTFAAVTSRTY
jgi:6-phosphogluconolactonase (cycloisomerase 2 family)